jgi:hypothetical protein
MKTATTRAACLAAALALGGCGADSEVTIGWAFGELSTDCASAGVQTVHVFIGPLAPSGFYDREVRCETGDSPSVITLRGVAPGRRTLVLKGLAQDKTLFYLEREIEVPAEDGARLGRFQVPAYVPP